MSEELLDRVSPHGGLAAGGSDSTVALADVRPRKWFEGRRLARCAHVPLLWTAYRRSSFGTQRVNK